MIETPPDGYMEKKEMFQTAEIKFGDKDSRKHKQKSSHNSENEKEFRELKKMVRAPKISYIYKKQNDLSAAFLYALGFSLIHFVFCFVQSFVSLPRRDICEKYDIEFVGNMTLTMKVLGKSIEDLDPKLLTLCQDSVDDLQFLVHTLMPISHLLIGFITLYRENFSNNQMFLVNTNKFMQIAALFFLMWIALNLMKNVQFWNSRLHQAGIGEITELLELGFDHPIYFSDPATFLEWSGRSIDWLKIEFLGFYVYFLTMVFYLIRSRCMSVGQDQSLSFDSVHMSLMANQIIKCMNFDINQEKRSRQMTKKRFTEEYRRVLVYNKEIFIKLSENDFNRINMFKL